MTPEPRPRLRPSSPASLVAAGLATAVVAWVLIGHFYGDLPRMSFLPALTIGLLALAEGVAARSTRARIEHRPGYAPVEPLQAARYAMLAKASALAGAIFAGAYTGMLVWLLGQRGQLAAAGDDIPPVAVCLGAAILLLAAALWLERSCRIPKGPGGDEEDVEPRDAA